MIVTEGKRSAVREEELRAPEIRSFTGYPLEQMLQYDAVKSRIAQISRNSRKKTYFGKSDKKHSNNEEQHGCDETGVVPPSNQPNRVIRWRLFPEPRSNG